MQACSEQGWGALSLLGLCSTAGPGESWLEGGRQLLLLLEGCQGVDCVISSPNTLVCFADIHQRGQTRHHPAAFPHHAGGFLGSGLGLHLHIGGCAEPAPGAGPGQEPMHSPALPCLPVSLGSVLSAFAPMQLFSQELAHCRSPLQASGVPLGDP